MALEDPNVVDEPAVVAEIGRVVSADAKPEADASDGKRAEVDLGRGIALAVADEACATGERIAEIRVDGSSVVGACGEGVAKALPTGPTVDAVLEDPAVVVLGRVELGGVLETGEILIEMGPLAEEVIAALESATPVEETCEFAARAPLKSARARLIALFERACVAIAKTYDREVVGEIGIFDSEVEAHKEVQLKFHPGRGVSSLRNRGVCESGSDAEVSDGFSEKRESVGFVAALNITENLKETALLGGLLRVTLVAEWAPRLP